MKIGYTLSSEEHDPQTLVKNAQIAEKSGFSFLGISDHFHPWVDKQGQSPFVWNVIGALSQVIENMDIFVEVNCPILRYHPAIIAQAAATSQYQLKGRFLLGVGTGENLNEHIVGKGWPPISIRQEMLKEAIEIMRKLWQGGYQSYFGKYFTIDAARIYTLPDVTVPIIVSAFGPKSAEIAGDWGDGLVTIADDQKVIDSFHKSGGKEKPMFIQISICYDKDPQKAKKIAKTQWPNAAMPKPLNSDLRLPQDFQNTAQLVQEEQLTQKIITGADPIPVIEKIKSLNKAGFENIYIHNIGSNQEEFMRWAAKEILPQFSQEIKNSPDIKFQAGGVTKENVLEDVSFTHRIKSKK